MTLEFLVGEGRLAQNVARMSSTCGELTRAWFAARKSSAPRSLLAFSVDEQLVEVVLDLFLARVLVPRIIRLPRYSAASLYSASDFSLPKRSTTWPTTASPRVFLGSKATLMPLARVNRLTCAFDVGRRRVELFARWQSLASLVILDQFGDVRRLRNRGADDFFGRNRTCRQCGWSASDTWSPTRLTSSGRDLGDAVAIDEHQPPIAGAGPFAQLAGRSSAAVGHRLFDAGPVLLLGAIDFLLGRRLGRRNPRRFRAWRRELPRARPSRPPWRRPPSRPGSCQAKAPALSIGGLLLSTSALYSRPDGCSPRIEPSTSMAALSGCAAAGT